MSTFMGARCTVCGMGITSGPHICGGTPTFPSVYERQFPELQAHLRDAITRYDAAEARVAELEVAARDLLDAMTRFGPDDSGQLWDAAIALRALLGSEAAS